MAYTPQQQAIINLALRLSARDSPRVRRSLLEAIGVESNFRNLNYGDRDSQGVLQQRPSTGWGPPGNPAVDIRQYLQRAERLDAGFRGTSGQLAQAIQRSAFPGRYDQRLGQANELLGSKGGLGAPAPRQSVSLGPSTDLVRQQLAQSLIAASQASSRHEAPDYSTVLQNVAALRSAREQGTPPLVQGGPRVGRSVGGPTGKPSLGFLTPLAREFGLSISSTTGGHHVEGSYHYQRRAEDYGGNPGHEAALMRYAVAHPREFTEAFYTGPGNPGFFVKNGKVYPNAMLDRSVAQGHRDHVHLAR